ncbi:hypothetical protein OC842_001379 [Tilletia horrida]|uniref:Anaphase-promoting complex subunit 4 WD40 domain-containing protein n=1 Tax=Tilletia horrida TaxID=155126 RepID=A0AAN6GF49_9BASI|nr:hypothetical protein OC842_001379 [Tilletia horrida]KAK0560820.1 hypothetical protein OC844_003548 [Tilletia horrida]
MAPLPGAEWRRPERKSGGGAAVDDGDEQHARGGGGGEVKLLHSFAAHKAAINTARWNSLGKYILTASSDRAISLWNAGSGPPCIKTYAGHSHDVHALDIAPDNATFASGGDDKSVLLWDVATAAIVRRFNQHVGRINDVRFAGAGASAGGGGEATHASNASTGNSVLLAAGFDTVVRAYDLRAANWRPIMEMKEAKDSITALALGKSTIFSASADGVIRSYDLRKGEIREDVFNKPIVSLTPNRNRSLLLVSTLDSTHRVLDLSDGTVLQTLRGHRNLSNRCHSVFTPDEASVLAGDETGILWRWDLLTADGAPVKPDQILSTKTAYGDRRRAADAPTRDPNAVQIAADVAHSRAVLWTEMSPIQNSGLCLTAGADGVLKIWQFS